MAAMLAESYGHRVVALANLLPADADVEELDSHCFQTVGHRAVASYGDLTGLPLFRRRLRGSSMRTDISYEVGADDTLGDEVEDLRALLAAVVDATPGVRAVTAGAILSDYQRLRVEAVCADLGLVSLAYMWRQPQPRVLDLICGSGVDAVLVKVAAMGLDPARHLGASLASLRATLLRVEREFGSHCAGEGGEFETLVLDCPLFRRGRLELVDPKVVVTSPDPFAPSGHLETAGGEVIPKRGGEGRGEGRGEGSRSSRDLASGLADSPRPRPRPRPRRGGGPRPGRGRGRGRHLGTSAPRHPISHPARWSTWTPPRPRPAFGSEPRRRSRRRRSRRARVSPGSRGRRRPRPRPPPPPGVSPRPRRRPSRGFFRAPPRRTRSCLAASPRRTTPTPPPRRARARRRGFGRVRRALARAPGGDVGGRRRRPAVRRGPRALRRGERGVPPRRPGARAARARVRGARAPARRPRVRGAARRRPRPGSRSR